MAGVDLVDRPQVATGTISCYVGDLIRIHLHVVEHGGASVVAPDFYNATWIWAATPL